MASALGLIGLCVGALAVFFPSLLRAAEKSWSDVGTSWTTWRAVLHLPSSAWWALRPMFGIIGVALIVFSALAVLFLLVVIRSRMVVSIGGSQVGIAGTGHQ